MDMVIFTSSYLKNAFSDYLTYGTMVSDASATTINDIPKKMGGDKQTADYSSNIANTFSQ
jgi:hypothetical protein